MEILKKIYKYGLIFVIDNIISKIFLLFPLKDTIFFESVPNLSDSPKCIFDELIMRGYNKKYKMIWWLYDDNYSPSKEIENVVYLKNNANRLLKNYYEYTSKCLICGNRFLEAHSKGQISFYIVHGSPLKKTSEYYNLPKGISYLFTAAKEFDEEQMKQFRAPIEKAISLGLPRNDVFANKENLLFDSLFGKKYRKVIVWYPTFRQHKSGANTGCTNALPIIHSSKIANELNEYLEGLNILLIIKPHFAQDTNKLETLDLDNIKLINDDFFVNHRISSYQFINACDALISDYSSVYYDYLLCDKPIGLVWEDIDEYKSNPGFSVDIDYFCKGGEKIFSLDDFKTFVDHISLGIDELRDERHEINALVNYSSDGKNTERVTNKIVELAKL